MKKTILLAAFLVSLSAITSSCKKDYVCKCSKTYTGNTSSTTSDYSKYTYKDTRKRAEDRCNANTNSGSDFWGNYSINCQIQ